MKTPLVYGTIMALIGALLTYGLFFAGLHDTPEKLQIAQWINSAVGIIAGVGCTVLAMRERRAEFPADREWGYGSALGTGILTGLVAVILGSILGYIYFAIVNPQFGELVYQSQVAKMEAKGMSSSQIDAAAGIMRKFTSPGAMILMQIVLGVVWSVILSLIIAIFFRSRNTAQPAEAVPPAA